MKICMVCYPTYGGSGVVATELGKSLAQKGHEVHFITYNRPIRLDLFLENIYYHEVTTPNYPLFETLPYESALASKMVDVVKYHKLDILHVHYAIPHASVAYLARQILRTHGIDIPVIVTLHGTDITLVGKDKCFEPVVSFAINESNGVTAVSDYLKKATFEGFHITNSIDVIPNFVDLQRFQRLPKEHFRKMLTTKGEKIIIHTSNFRKVKRIDEVVRIFDIIRQNMPAKLLMIGDGPQRKPAEDLSRELGVFEDIYFLGSQDPVEELYSIGDLFLLPSETETFGLAALEAMACGIPVITTNAGGLPEVVKDNESGYCCEVGDYQSMAAKSVELLNDFEKWTSFSEKARKIAEHFSMENIVPQYEALYRRIIETSESKITFK